MDAVLLAGLHVINARCIDLKGQLASLPPLPELAYQRAQSTAVIDELTRRVLLLIGERIGNPDPLLLPGQIKQFQRLAGSIDAFESVALTALVRFGPTDRRLTYFCRRLTSQVLDPVTNAPPFIVSTLSSSGYASFAYVGVLQVPAAEECSLLGLPDLLHEVGHWVYDRYRPTFDDFAKTDVDPHFGPQIAQVPTGSHAARFLAELTELWHRGWLQEFASDLFATWALGAPYLLQHLRLCFSRKPDPFMDQGVHPADHARMLAMRSLLIRCGPAGAAILALVDPAWTSYLAHYASQGVVPTPDFELRYPPTLIDGVAEAADDLFTLVRVRRFDGPACDAPDLPNLLEAAWTNLGANVAGYVIWEQQTLAALWPQIVP